MKSNESKFFIQITYFFFSVLLVAGVSLQAESVKNTTLYVSKAGNDLGNGSITAPIATLQKAAELARAQKGAVTIYVAPGKYFMGSPLRLTEKDSHVSWITNGKAILTGAKTLPNLNWTLYKDGIWVTDTEKNLKIDQLFVDGTQQILARYPNYDPKQILQGSAKKHAIKLRSVNWKDPTGGYIRALHQYKWGGNSYRITGKNNGALGLSYKWVGDNNRGSGMHSSHILVENIFEELDSEKEWFYDAKKGKLYFKPAAGVVPNSKTLVEVAVSEELIHIEGKDNTEGTAKDISFTGFTLENTARTLFTGTYVPLMRSDWCVVRSGALYLKSAENVIFKNGIIRNIGGNAVFMNAYNRNDVISNNEITNIGASGVLIAGDPNSCREPSFWSECPTPEATPHFIHKTSIEDQTVGPKAKLYPVHCEVSYNHIKNIGIWEKQSSQVALSVASRIKILHNTINIGPRAGINIGDGTFGGHEIAYNDIFDVQLETNDHGMFNSWGRDRFWSLGGFDGGGNRGAIKEPVSRLDCYEPTRIHNNRIYFGSRMGGGRSFGIDLDDGSSYYEIYNNLCLNIGIKLREGFHRTVYNNIIVNAPFHLHCTFQNSTDRIYRNLMICGAPYSLAATSKSRFAKSKDFIDKNWFWNFGEKITFPNFWDKLGFDHQSIIGTEDPVFRDPANLDYTVTNQKIVARIGFENFPMDQFGKPGCPEVCPSFVKTRPDHSLPPTIRKKWQGATFTPINEGIMSSTGAGSLKGLYLENVPTTSAAASYGFKTGDVLHTLNGKELQDGDDFVSKYNRLPAGAQLQVGIIRNQLSIKIDFIKGKGVMTMIDDRDPQIQYDGDNWDYASRNRNPHNSNQCYNHTITYKNLKRSKSAAKIALSFVGRRIVLFGRKDTNMGNYRILITDKTGSEEINTLASAYHPSGRLDQTIIYDSKDLLKDHEHTITITPESGDYIILDGFGIYNLKESCLCPKDRFEK